MVRLTAHFTGRVQGVGFRATAADLAARYDVTGTVENLRDGRVRLIAEGDRAELDAFLADIQRTMARHIQQTQTDFTEATGAFEDFRIVH